MTHKLNIISGALVAFVSAQVVVAQDAVTWWYESANPDQQAWLTEFMIDEFNSKNPNNELSIDYRGSELDKQLRVALLSGTGPDVVNTPGPSFVATMARAGQLMELDDIANDKGWNDRILPFFMDLGRLMANFMPCQKPMKLLAYFIIKLFLKIMAGHRLKLFLNYTHLQIK